MTCHLACQVDCQVASAAISASTAPRFNGIELAKWLGIAQENCALRLTEAGAMKCEVYFAMAGYSRLAPAVRLFGAAFSKARCTDCNRLAPHPSFGGSIQRSQPVFLIGACRHDPLHHGDEPLLVCLAQIGHRLTVGGTGRRFHLAQQCCPGSCQSANLRAAISVVD